MLEDLRHLVTVPSHASLVIDADGRRCRARDRRVLIVPAITFPLSAVGSIWIVVYDAVSDKPVHDSKAFQTQYFALTVSLFACTLCITWYFTGLMCYRLWSVDRRKREVFEIELGQGTERPTITGCRKNPYSKVMRTLVQSGMLYSVMLGAWMVCLVAGFVSRAAFSLTLNEVC